MMHSVLNDPVLVLDKFWVAVNTINVRKAFEALFVEKCKFLYTNRNPEVDDELNYTAYDLDGWIDLKADGDYCLRTAYKEIRVPEIVVFDHNFNKHKKSVQCVRKNIIRRDRGICQYCGIRPKGDNLTIDHIIPKSKGGADRSWTNNVVSCSKCNCLKSDYTLDQVAKLYGMRLLPRPELQVLHPNDPEKWDIPYAPSWSPIGKIMPDRAIGSWLKFIGGKM